MRPSAHFSSAIIFLSIISFFYVKLSMVDWLLFLGGTIGIDLDYLLRFVFKEQNHRKYWTHSPIFWVILLILVYFLRISWIFWAVAGILLHLLLDIIDWGLYLSPYNKNALFPYLFRAYPKLSSEKEFSFYYWRNPAIVTIEGFLFIGAVGGMYFHNFFLIDVLPMILAFFLIVYAGSFYDYYRGRKLISNSH